MGFLPNPLHPALVHFPIALSLVALLLEFVARHPRARGLQGAAGFVMVLAALGAVAAVLSGNAAHDEAVVPPAAAPLVARHEEVGELAMWVLLGVAVVRVLLGWRGWFKGFVPWAYLLVAAAAAGLVGYNGYLGGKMVFDHGLGTAPVQRAPVKGGSLVPSAPLPRGERPGGVRTG